MILWSAGMFVSLRFILVQYSTFSVPNQCYWLILLQLFLLCKCCTRRRKIKLKINSKKTQSMLAQSLKMIQNIGSHCFPFTHLSEKFSLDGHLSLVLPHLQQNTCSARKKLPRSEVPNTVGPRYPTKMLIINASFGSIYDQNGDLCMGSYTKPEKLRGGPHGGPYKLRE